MNGNCVYVAVLRRKRLFRKDQVIVMGAFSKRKWASAAIKVGPPFDKHAQFEIVPLTLDQGNSKELF